MTCPLCTSKSHFYFEDKKRSYRQCSNCALVFVPDEFILSTEDEKAEYDLHENDPCDPGYRKFLSRVFNPVNLRIPAPAKGLDFGCGPGPVLCQMFEESGYIMSKYDPFYFPDKSTLEVTYDFVTCTEVIEHIKDSNAAFDLLFKMTKKGLLGIMTKMVLDREAFANWHYKSDPTHIRFFSKTTFEYIARLHEKNVEFVDKDVIIFN